MDMFQLGNVFFSPTVKGNCIYELVPGVLI